MVHFLLPKIHRQRKKVRREMARQKRMLDSLGLHLAREAEKESSEVSRKPWDSLGESHSLLMEECPADNLRHSSALMGDSGLAGVPNSVPHSPPTEAGDGGREIESVMLSHHNCFIKPQMNNWVLKSVFSTIHYIQI